MARKFNTNQPSNKKQPNYNNPRSGKIQKQQKKDNPKPSNVNSQKTISPGRQSFPPPSVQNTSQKPPISTPVEPPQTQSKPITEAAKNNLAKLASINKLMGINAPVSTGNVSSTAGKTGKQQSSGARQGSQVTLRQGGQGVKSLVKKPNPQQLFQTLQSLKDLQKLLDSYEELEMDQNCNLKQLLEFLEAKKPIQQENAKV